MMRVVKAVYKKTKVTVANAILVVYFTVRGDLTIVH